MENNKKKYVVIGLIVCILLLIFFLIFVLGNSLKKNDNNKTSTTTTSIKKENILKDSSTGIIINYSDSSEIKDTNKLVVSKVNDKIDIENLISVYDINIVDKNNKLVNVDNTKLKIRIPFDNSFNYNYFKVLYLDNNEVKETINATYNNGNIIFYVNHLSRYAIVATKEENTTTTSTTTIKQQTTKKNGSNTTTVKQQETTKNQETTAKKQETTKKQEPTTTKKPQETTTTTTTTKKVKTYNVVWGNDKDAAGQQYLYIVDDSVTKVSGSVLVSYKGSDYSETMNVTTNGILLIKDIVTISNVKGN